MKKLNKKKNKIKVRIGIRRRRIYLRRAREYHLLKITGRKRRSFVEAEIKAPRVMSISKNGKETIEFFDSLKSAALLQRRREKARGLWRPAPLYIDLSTIRSISLPTAVILAAELHRWRILSGINLKPRRYKYWTPRVRRLLVELGVFDLLGIMRNEISPVTSDDEIAMLPLSSGEKTEGEKFHDLQRGLIKLGAAFKSKLYIFDGISEAATNSIDHAYKSDGMIKPKYPYAGHRWWATSCYDPTNGCLRFFVYDQGVGIARTIEIEPEWNRPIQVVLAKLGRPSNEADVIVGAFEIGKTSIDEAGRGRGLNQMLDVIIQAGDGHLRVTSGRGDVKYDSSGRAKKNHLHSHIGGTLIEWSIPIVTLR